MSFQWIVDNAESLSINRKKVVASTQSRDGTVRAVSRGNAAKRFEVKRDRRWHETGNLYIEVECWYNSTQSWQASGIAVTEADYWAFVLEESVLMIPTAF